MKSALWHIGRASLPPPIQLTWGKKFKWWNRKENIIQFTVCAPLIWTIITKSRSRSIKVPKTDCVSESTTWTVSNIIPHMATSMSTNNQLICRTDGLESDIYDFMEQSEQNNGLWPRHPDYTDLDMDHVILLAGGNIAIAIKEHRYFVTIHAIYYRNSFTCTSTCLLLVNAVN